MFGGLVEYLCLDVFHLLVRLSYMSDWPISNG